MMDLYLKTLAVVLGILSPGLLVLVLLSIKGAIKWHSRISQLKLEEARKRPPFRAVELYKVPNDAMVGIRFKGWDGTTYELCAMKSSLLSVR